MCLYYADDITDVLRAKTSLASHRDRIQPHFTKRFASFNVNVWRLIAFVAKKEEALAPYP